MEIKIGSKENEIVICSGCKKEISTKDGFTFKDKTDSTIYLCDDCKKATEKEFEKETENPNLTFAILLGCIGGLVSGFIWYFLTVWTDRQIGYIAIGVGFVIGWAVMFGSGGKRGMTIQITSAAITLVTLLCSQYFIVLYYIRKYVSENTAEYPNYDGSFFFLSPFNSDFMASMFSPMGVIIWLIGIYFAFSFPKSRAVE